MSQTRRDELPDHYETLEVSPHASYEVIQAAYRVLARNAHPDRNPDGDAGYRIRHINAAYAVLGDPSHRAKYDLECARARRSERMRLTGSDIGLRRQVDGAEAARVLAARRVAVATREERIHVVSLQAVIMVCAVVCLALVMGVVLWMSIDAALSDDSTSLDPLPLHSHTVVQSYPFGPQGR